MYGEASIIRTGNKSMNSTEESAVHSHTFARQVASKISLHFLVFQTLKSATICSPKFLLPTDLYCIYSHQRIKERAIKGNNAFAEGLVTL
jgi:hypothetical protein